MDLSTIRQINGLLDPSLIPIEKLGARVLPFIASTSAAAIVLYRVLCRLHQFLGIETVSFLPNS